MNNGLELRVKKALDDFVMARKGFIEAMGISADDALPAPASESDVLRLEEAIGESLPASYRCFLLMQDGFPEFDGECSLLGVDDMISLLASATTDVLDKIAAASGDDDMRRCIVFAMSEQSAYAFLFSSEEKNATGEWTVIEYDEDEGIDAVHTSFLAFLEKSAAEARAAEQETLAGNDLLDLDF
jgi:hypothetical protein